MPRTNRDPGQKQNNKEARKAFYIKTILSSCHFIGLLKLKVDVGVSKESVLDTLEKG